MGMAVCEAIHRDRTTHARSGVSVAALVIAAQVVLIPWCGSTSLPPRLTPSQRERVAAAPFHTVTVGVERFTLPAYSERLTAGLGATHVFARVDDVKAFDTPPTFVARVERPIHGRAIVPLVTALSLGLIPMTVEEEEGYAFSLTPSAAPTQAIPVEFSYLSTSTLGWWALLLNLSSDRTASDLYHHPRVIDRLAWTIIEHRERLCEYAGAACGTPCHSHATSTTRSGLVPMSRTLRH